MRIAIIADIHGNVAALEAALADIAARRIEQVVCLGDCASGMMWPRETTEMLMERGISCVRGNHDRWLVEHAPEAMGAQDALAYAETTQAQRAWLGSLPSRLWPAPGVLACHGTPESDVQNLLEEPGAGRLGPAPLETIRSRLGPEGQAARVVLCGHSHQAGLLQVPDGPLLVNPGSLGLPGFRVTRGPHPHIAEARSPHARYAVLTVEEVGICAAELIALSYDWEAAARRAEANGAPVWAQVLRTGFVPLE